MFNTLLFLSSDPNNECLQHAQTFEMVITIKVEPVKTQWESVNESLKNQIDKQWNYNSNHITFLSITMANEKPTEVTKQGNNICLEIFTDLSHKVLYIK